MIPVNLAAAPVTVANIDFQWKDGWYYAIGGEYDINPALTVRAGLAYEESPIDKPTSRLLQLPDNDRIWASLGASYKWSEKITVDFAYSHVFIKDGEFERVPATAAAPKIYGTTDSSVDILSVGLKSKF